MHNICIRNINLKQQQRHQRKKRKSGNKSYIYINAFMCARMQTPEFNNNKKTKKVVVLFKIIIIEYIRMLMK